MLTPWQQEELGVALNEATLVDVQIDPHSASAVITFAPLSLPEEGELPDEYTVQFRLGSVGRVVASLRGGSWDDPTAPITPFLLEELSLIVRSFNQLPIYGWEFFGTAETQLANLGARISLDWTSATGGSTYTLRLFQEGSNRFLDLLLWFDSLEIRDQAGKLIPIDTFIADGIRWWDALQKGDPRTGGRGIYPLK